MNTNLDATNETIEIVAEQAELPFILARHWLLLYPIDPRARLLYELLVMHINVSRGDNEVRATKAALAEMMGFKKPDSLDPYLKALYDSGLAMVTKNRTADGLRDKNTYTVRLRPPRGYTGPLSLGDWYRRTKETAGQSVVPSSGVRRNQTNDVSAGGYVPPQSGVRTPLERGLVPPQSGVELNALELDKPSSSSKRSNGAMEESKPDGRDDDDEKAGSETPEQPQPPTQPVQTVLDGLNWGRHPRPSKTQQEWLYGPLKQALDLGWAEQQLVDYCNAAIARAKDFPGKYLINALGPQWLGLPPKPTPSKPHTMSPSRIPEATEEIDPEKRKAILDEVKGVLKSRGHYREGVPA